MRSNGRLQRALAIRHLGNTGGAAFAPAEPEPGLSVAGDLKLFAFTFVGGFLFTSIFIA